MKNFLCIARGVNTSPALLQLATQSDLWNQHTLRTTTEGSPHRGIDDIWLRMNDLAKCAQRGAEFVDHRESINYPAMQRLTAIRPMVIALAHQVEAERIGRCLISRLTPGKQIGRHKDIGDDLSVYYDNEPYYSRFHIVLQGLPGSVFTCGEETVCMQSGEVWWFRNDVEHYVINNSADDRIHVVCDMRTSRYAC